MDEYLHLPDQVLTEFTVRFQYRIACLGDFIKQIYRALNSRRRWPNPKRVSLFPSIIQSCYGYRVEIMIKVFGEWIVNYHFFDDFRFNEKH